ncbi:TetR/AcrR family transcriptional regulator [Demequina capsici]|uniref:TetR/AcrR family transcriptional regulator n=1 Tax=Demequina capsici TaxID=3075620 RepID=A0AA96JBL2_9MICO|nr:MULTISPECIES: TetR/AcrR family transcriptional regulator [unclassified Demequina]WNM25846.1 TetR/AcrR family transcriptional regulator [Demequina sp. OYTSA14]WNM28741.1 TetR/AcrR family transcriptional regulator [Demequina sp. PMTSA13]
MSTSAASEHGARTRGRPRDPALRERILEAAATLAMTSGVELGFERIAQEAGASRTTLYRWWDSPEELLLDAMLERTRWSLDHDSEGTAAARLRAQVYDAVEILSAPDTGKPLRALAAGALTNEKVRSAFNKHWLGPRREVAARILSDGMIRGEFRQDLDVEAVIDALFSPIYHRLLLTRMPMGRTYAATLWDLVGPGLRPD